MERRAVVAMIVAKLPGTTVDWTSGHGRLLAAGNVFCSLTREGDLVLYLPPDRREDLLATGEVKLLQYGKRVVAECVVLDARAAAADPAWTLELLREARAGALRKKPGKTA